MEPLHLSEITTSLKYISRKNFRDVVVKGVSVDSRTLKKDFLFIAVKGEHIDGHRFVLDAVERGASAIVVSNQSYIKNITIPILVVKDTIEALGDIAQSYRAMFSLETVAVTGSNGKTTTKELISHILSFKFNTVKSIKSYNNFIGVPLSIFEINKKTQKLILEMETNIFGGIRRLCEISNPSIGVITNIGSTHLETLRTRYGVFKEKKELIDSVPQDGFVVLNADDDYTGRIRKTQRNIITFGIENKADFFAEKIKIKKKHIEFSIKGFPVKLETVFFYNIYNVLAAFVVGYFYRFGLEEMSEMLNSFSFPPMRMELTYINGINIINDVYNANPDSVKCALNSLNRFNSSGKKIAVLGDMLELGDKEELLHYDIGKFCYQNKIDYLFTFGKLSKFIAEGARKAGMNKQNIFEFIDKEELVASLYNILSPQDTILVKGSRKMKMEEIIGLLKKRLK